MSETTDWKGAFVTSAILVYTYLKSHYCRVSVMCWNSPCLVCERGPEHLCSYLCVIKVIIYKPNKTRLNVTGRDRKDTGAQDWMWQEETEKDTMAQIQIGTVLTMDFIKTEWVKWFGHVGRQPQRVSPQPTLTFRYSKNQTKRQVPQQWINKNIDSEKPSCTEPTQGPYLESYS